MEESKENAALNDDAMGEVSGGTLKDADQVLWALAVTYGCELGEVPDKMSEFDKQLYYAYLHKK